MSQNYNFTPTFDFTPVDESGYGSQTAPFQDTYFQPWSFPTPGTAVHSVPSPTDTLNTVYTAPPQANVPRISIPQTRKSIQRSSSVRNGHYLTPHRRQVPVSNRNNSEQMLDTMARWTNSDEPWNPHQMRNPTVDSHQNIFQISHDSFGQYRQRPCSDVDNVSDSGYHTQPPPSVLSNEPGRPGQELPQEILLRTMDMNVGIVPDAPQPMLRTASDQRSVSQHSSRSGASRQQFPCPDPTCLVISKCKSEYKKHMLKHEKNFICTESGCRRGGQGFSTVNDLDRHKKSVHKIGVANSKSYKCAASTCGNKDKIWPRLDNFKQHIERMHKTEDLFELIKLSEYHPPKLSDVQESLSTDPALFACMGGSDDNLLSPHPNNYSYQPNVSFNASFMSSTADMSPSTISPDLSFPSCGASLPVNDHISLQRNMSTHSSTDGIPNGSIGRRRSTKASQTSVTSTSTSTVAPGSCQKRKSTSQPALSDGPQTKAEQQQIALAKMSKTDVDVGEIMRRLLDEGQRSLHSSRALSENEKKYASQVIADLLKQRSGPIQTQQRRMTQSSASGALQHCDYSGCSFTGRTCDLNKHKKRHAKPYGCTYPKCHKRFGAKSDWKRHENSQHFQLEAFHCDHQNGSGKKCGDHFNRPAQFQKHLADKHNITAGPQVETRVQRCRIGKNCQGQFWCGFCRSIEILKNKRNAAWDERFDHIARHFEKEKRQIDDWLCVEANRTKRELQEEIDRDDFPDEIHMEVDAEANDDDGQPEAQVDCSPTITSLQSPIQDHSPENSDKVLLWLCCGCNCGPATYSIQDRCHGCSHACCDNCPRYFEIFVEG